ncbi:glycosyltransferase family 2 protein [Nocardioides humilatus]|uniref:Glycosyltransferase family 2 protein n=1 Tax=Nocardioides humilatus TaxID=2607660 RepID=A0A5B1L890_9ACTN|nr:glycosyltransferase [Nocardioides humilatus]KAA1415949.1 glycosyltransferase family 2 protein [Nocardioides humilatus]
MGRYQRAAGLLIFGAAATAALLLVAAVSRSPRDVLDDPGTMIVGGGFQVFYDASGPSWFTILLAASLAVFFASAVSSLERMVTTRSRRSRGDFRTPLAPNHVMDATRGVFAGPVTLTVLIPAHNEESCLAATITSLLGQSRPPERIIVVADNCTDGTVEIARAAGVDVYETIGNRDKKAGGLNQALKGLLPHQRDNDLVMVMDADTVLGAGFLERAVQLMTADRALMAIGGLFYGDPGGGLLGQFQRNEYTRYARDLRRRRGLVFVLTGTASIFRPRALCTVAAERGRLLPGVPGQYFDTVALTEDNEITLALKSLGALVISPAECTVVTEIMTTWRALWVQRLRWQRGALENLGAYGVHGQTWRYWLQQLGLGYGVIALTGYLSLMAVTAASVDTVIWFPFWLGIGSLFAAERAITVWRGGWHARLLAIVIFPELFYAFVLALIWLKGVLDITGARAAAWHYADRAEPSLELRS